MTTLRVEDIPVEKVVLGKSQARASELEKGLDDLAESMDKWGLLEPITVFLNDDKKYEILAGQRRFSAARRLNWKTVTAVIRQKPADEFEAKALSLTENITTNPMTTQDIMDSCDMLFKRYGDTKLVAKAIGIKESFVKKYIKYERLPQSLKKAVDSGQLSDDPNKAIGIALKAADALQSEEGGKISETKIVEFAKVLAKKTAKEQKDLVDEAKRDPARSLPEISAKAAAPKKEKKLILVMDTADYSRLENFGKKEKSSSAEDAALGLIADGLGRAGF